METWEDDYPTGPLWRRPAFLILAGVVPALLVGFSIGWTYAQVSGASAESSGWSPPPLPQSVVISQEVPAPPAAPVASPSAL
jgi:hypothetical protein